MAMMKRVSVIIPAYNVESFLKRAVDSVLAQEYDDFELLIVNDGSTDATGELADRFAAQDKRVSVIHQSNRGLSGARNAGLETRARRLHSTLRCRRYVASP